VRPVMVGKAPAALDMTPETAPIDPGLLPERVAALPGVSALRDAVAAAGVDAYLVGGGVRDVLLGADRADLDVAVEGDPLVLAGRLEGPPRLHDRFGTATAAIDGVRVDIARTRRETYPSPGALPDVEPASLADDLARRDFTVNAMAVPLHAQAALIDPRRGFDDLRSGLLRALHKGSFVDDPTRALRAARYAGRLGFELEPQTEELLRASNLQTVSEDRIEAELLRLAAEPSARRGFELLDEWGLIALDAGGGDLIAEIILLLAVDPWRSVAARSLVVYAAATGHGPGPLGRRRDLREAARELVDAGPARPSDAVELASGRGDVELVLARAMSARWLDDYLSSWRHVELEISGEDLLAQGVPEGPGIGRGLAAALRAKLDGEVSGRQAELEFALTAARDAGP
jgi:tRNA nucleotidyltransferase (CCA-adding enzyme)